MQQLDRKYDRQLRIWGEQGQTALEHARICLLNCGPTGSEVLKNLVLGGIGSVTVVDNSKVAASDLGNNFLVAWDNLGHSKAATVCSFLQELNDSVKANYVVQSPEALLDSDPDFVTQFKLVIATQMAESALVKVDEICRQHNVMLLVARSYGLAGLLRISVKEHYVIESKPDNKVEDLRLHKPWPELKMYMDEFDLDTKDAVIHKHIPFAVILFKTMEHWKLDHGGQLPATLRELKAAINARRYSEDEDNYKEALKAAYLVLSPPGIKPELRAVLGDKKTEVDLTSTDFWVMVAALKLFMENEGEGEPPLEGTLPDMHSFTEYYIGLQKVYQAKAEADVLAMEERIKSICTEIGRSEKIEKNQIKLFCKNSRNLQVLRYPPLSDEFNLRGFEIQKLLSVEDSSNAALYMLFRAVDLFAAKFSRYPGVLDGELDEDVSRLKVLAVTLLSDMGSSGANLPDDLISEFCRFGAAELHCVASVVGGIAAQEAIKLLTRQFTPVKGTLIYNAIKATSMVLNL